MDIKLLLQIGLTLLILSGILFIVDGIKITFEELMSSRKNKISEIAWLLTWFAVLFLMFLSTYTLWLLI